VEEFISEELCGKGLQAPRHVSEPKWHRELHAVSQEHPSTVHPADRDQHALTSTMDYTLKRLPSGEGKLLMSWYEAKG